MNRREFLRSLALVPIALATKVQVEPKPVSEAYKFRTIDEIALGKSPSETFARMGKKVFDGYVEGIQKPISGMVITVYDHTEFEKVRWDDIPEVLPQVEFEFKSLGSARKIDIL